MKLTIDRKKWLRGEGEGVLLDSADGRMCCLGFLGKACGIDSNYLEDTGNPSDVDCAPKRHKSIWALMGESLKKARRMKALGAVEPITTVENVLIVINDNQKIKDAQRENLLIKEFAALGVQVEFIN